MGVLAYSWLCLQAFDLDTETQSRRESRLRGKRLRVEVLLAGAAAPKPLPMKDLVEVDLWDQLPSDLPGLLARLPQADLYLQDEIQFAFHPTLTRVWSCKGRREQRFIDAPDQKVVFTACILSYKQYSSFFCYSSFRFHVWATHILPDCLPLHIRVGNWATESTSVLGLQRTSK